MTAIQEIQTSPRTLCARALRYHLGDALDDVRFKEERILITRNGKPVAALVPVKDLERLP